jgi:hypothetical protein
MSLMRQSPLIYQSQLNRALFHVQNELHSFGLWYEYSKLPTVDVMICRMPRREVRGLFYHGDNAWSRMTGYYEGKIYIPVFSLAHRSNSKNNSLRDVIRHEYAHAFAHYYPELIFITEFVRVFGGSYNSQKALKMHAKAYVSEYARTLPMEDFAETFMIFLKCKGKLPAGAHPKLATKWKFVQRVIKSATKSDNG